jgi:site-specific recombinase XerD
VLPFPEKLKLLLWDYFSQYRPECCLLEGQFKNRYTTSSLCIGFSKVMQKAKIDEKLCLHSLRHANATHLMKARTDLRGIKKLLGHNNFKTTLMYTQVSNKTLENVSSPIDFVN